MRIRNKLLVSVVLISILLISLIAFTSQGRTRPGVIDGLLGRIITPVQEYFTLPGSFLRIPLRTYTI